MERRRYPNPEDQPPLQPFELPPELAAFLAEHEVACLFHPTDQGTAFVAKLPAAEIASLRGRVPIHLRHELYAHPAAPVIRSVVTICDQPDHPLALESYTNVAEEDQRADFATLSEQDQFMLLFYDDRLAHRLTKLVPQDEPIRKATTAVLREAERLLVAIPPEHRNFDRAKQAVLEATQL